MKKGAVSQATSLFIIAILLIVWFSSCAPIQEVAPGNDRFGLCFISAADHLADETRYLGALDTGARWDRWPLYWHWVDEGGYVGSHAGGTHDYDMLVRQEITYGLTPIVILLGTPARYANTNPTGADNPPQNSFRPGPNVPSATANSPTIPPASLAEPIFVDGTDVPGPGKTINPTNVWAHFVFTTVDRYRPLGSLARQEGWAREAGIRYWEVWNEPDFYSFWNGTVEEYYRLLEVAYKSIKTADPEATVLLGGLAFIDQDTWFSALLQQMEAQPDRAYFDIFSFHHYASIYETERLTRQVRASLDAHQLTEIPLWITESGLSVWDDYPATTQGITRHLAHQGTMIEQAAYVIQNSALAFYHGVERYYHFKLHDDCSSPPGSAYGLRQNFTPHVCDPAEGKPRPAYAAYKLAAEQFRNLIPLWRVKQSNQDQVAFYRPDDQSRLVVLWATQGLTATTTLSATSDQAQLHWIEPIETPSGTSGLSHTLTLTPTNNLYTLTLLPATSQNSGQADGLPIQIGGLPLIVVEKDTQPPHTHIEPLPSTSPSDFVVQWQGEDFGSGIAGYDVFVSEDDEPLQLWLEDTIQTRTEHTGQVGHTYSFAVRARDRAGNEQPVPTEPQITTQVISGSTVSGVVLGPGGEPVANANVAITGSNARENIVTNRNGLWPAMALRPGNYTIRASAAGYGSWPALRRINLNNAPLTITTTLAPPTNAITHGDFEGDQMWQVWQKEGNVTLSRNAFDGQAAARLGSGPGGNPTECPDGQPGHLWVLRQPVSIPNDPGSVLSFLYRIISSQDSTQRAWFEVLLVIGGQPYYLVTPNELQPTPDWALASLDVSTWQGRTADLEFRVQRCSNQAFSVNLDRISIGPMANP